MRFFLAGLVLCAFAALAVHAADEDERQPSELPQGNMVLLGPIPIPLWLMKQKAASAPLAGRCELKLGNDSNLSVPCENIELGLLDGKGAVVESVRAKRGRFSFAHRVEKDFQIAAISKKYRTRAPASKDAEGRFLLTLEPL